MGALAESALSQTWGVLGTFELPSQ
jgi:hypothetical protein